MSPHFANNYIKTNLKNKQMTSESHHHPLRSKATLDLPDLTFDFTRTNRTTMHYVQHPSEAT